MKYLLDTNICIYIIKKKPPQIIEKFSDISPIDVGISSITISELYYGIYKNKYQDRNREALFQFLLPLNVIVYDGEAAEIYGRIRSQLEKDGQIIGAMDLLIAAQAISRDLILVTNNQKEFSRISSLKSENWI